MSEKIVAIDLDGTVLNYGNHVGEIRVNDAFISQLRADGVNSVVIATNQGGLVWSKSSAKYPTPQRFVERVAVAVDTLAIAGIRVLSVHASLFHPKADELAIVETKGTLLYYSLGVNVPLAAHTEQTYRKPHGGMLEAIGCTDYYGDSPEDEKAAVVAGATFHPVVRFE